MKLRFNPRVIYTVLSALFILGGTFLAIQYAKGYYRFTRQGVISTSGLLSANSFPTGAEVYVNSKLVTATDDTLYLEPNEYEVEIVKEGYWPWRKKLEVEKELVTQTNAQLFPIAPSLIPLTFTGVVNLAPSPDGQKIVFYSASASAKTKNGIYLLELSDNFLSLQRGPIQLTNDLPELQLDKAEYIWSPDSREVMVLTPQKEVLLELTTKQNLETLPDISFQRARILSEWEEEMYIRERQFLREFPPEMLMVATTSARNVYLSPDKKRLLYTATAAMTLPEDIVPPVPATNTQPEERALQPGSIYLYDREEDKNFKVGVDTSLTSNKQLLANDLSTRQPITLEASPSAFTRLQASESAQTAFNFNLYHTALFAQSYQWFPDSKHLIYSTDRSVQIVEYDGTNDTPVYSGPFAPNFVYPWPDGSRVLVLTTFNPETPANLYAIELR